MEKQLPFDQLQVVEAPQNATDSAIPTYCGVSGSNKVVATIDLTSTTTNSYVDFTRSQNSPQLLSPGVNVSYLLCGRMKSTFVSANSWASQGAAQPTNMVPMFQYKNIATPSAPVLSNVTATPASPTYLLSTTLRGSMNMAGTVSFYSDSACGTAALASNISNTAIATTGATVAVTANATTGIYYVSAATDGTPSLCTKVMDFVNNTTVPSVTFQGPSATQTKNTNVTVAYSISGGELFYTGIPTNYDLIKTGTANGTLTISGTAGAYTGTISSITGDGTIVLRAKASAAMTNAGLGNAQTDSASILVDNTAPTITGTSSWALAVATALDTAISDTGAGVNTSDPLAVAWTQTSGTAGAINLTASGGGSGWNTVAPTVSATIADTYGLRLTVKDRVGNTSTKDITVVWNAAKPTVSIGSPSIVYTNGTSVVWTVTYGNFVSVDSAATLLSKITLNAAAGVTATKAVTGSNGNYTVTLSSPNGNGTLGFTIPASTATTNVGLTSDAATSATTLVDTLSPTFNLASSFVAATQVAIAPTSVVDSGSGVATYAWSYTTTSGGTLNFNGTSSSATANVTASLDGDYTLKLRITDNAGNYTEKTTILTWAATPPTVVISSGPSVAQVKTGASLTYGLTLTGCNSVQSNANLASTYTSLTTVGTASSTRSITGSGSSRTVTLTSFAGDGTQALNVLAAACTNIASVPSAANGPGTSFKVDNTPPTVAITGASGPFNAQFTASSTVSDPNLSASPLVAGSGIASYSWTKTAGSGTLTFGSSTSASTTISGSTDDTYTIQLAVTDAAGNVGTATSQFTWSVAQAEVSIGTPTPTGPVSTASISFPVTYAGATTVNLTSAKVTLNKTGTANATVSILPSNPCVTSSCTVQLSSLTGSGSLGITIVAGSASNLGGWTDSGSTPSSTVVVDNSTPVFAAVSQANYTPMLAAKNQGYSCAILQDGSLKCWGRNEYSQLGYSDTTTRGNTSGSMASLAALNLGTGAVAAQVATGDFHTCAILGNGSVKCWGSNLSGQLGIDSSTTSTTLASTSAVNLGSGRTAIQIAAGRSHTCAVLDNGTLKCWGMNDVGQLGYDNTTYVGMSAGSMAALGTVNLGTGRKAVKVTAGDRHTCALLDDSTVKCWGLNDNGQLGYNDTTNRGATAGSMAALSAVTASTSTFTDISAGFTHTCGITTSGQLLCWGANSSGQLGYGDTTNRGNTAGSMASLGAVNIGTGRTAVQVSSGVGHTCVIRDDGAAMCWGWNSNINILGIDSASTSVTSPSSTVTLGTGRKVVYISAGWNTSCAMLDDLSVKCWGYNYYGQLGIDSTSSVAAMSSLAAVNLGQSARLTAINVNAVAPVTIGTTVTDPETSFTVGWSNLSASMGTISFGTPSSATTTASASAAGTYRLRLTATNAVSLALAQDYLLNWYPPPPVATIGAPSRVYAKTGDSATYSVTYTNAQTSTLGAGNITLNTTGTATGTATVSGSGSSYTVTISGLSGNGTVGFSIAANTAFNNGVYAAAAGPSATFLVDNTLPTVSSGGNRSAGVQITLNGSASDGGSGLASTAWSMVSGPGTITWGSQNSASTSITASANGDYTLRLTATDNSGNVATSDMVLTWNATPPSIVIASPSATSTTTGSITYDITYTGASTYTLSASDVTTNITGTAVIGTKTVALLTSPNVYRVTLGSITGNGQVSISLASGTAANNAGIQAPAAGPSATFKVDNSAPTSSIPAMGAIGLATSVTATASDPDLVASPQVTGVGGLTYTWSKVSGPGTVSFSPANALTTSISANSDGSYVVQLVATDALGNASTVTQSFTWAATRPTLTISAPTPSVTNSAAVTYTVSYTNASNITLATGNITVNRTGTAGVPTVTVSGTGSASRSTNSAGLADTTGAGPSATFTVDKTPPAAPVITSVDGNSGVGSTIYTTNLMPVIAGTAEASATVNILDGGAAFATVTANGTGAWSYTPPANISQATHTFTATATDAAGNPGSSSATVTAVTDNTAPTAPSPFAVNTGATTQTTMTVTWPVSPTTGASSDNVTVPLNLQYLVQYSTSSATLDASRVVGMNWTGSNVAQAIISGLTPGTPYWFWLKVKDQTGNTAVSSAISGTTTYQLPATPSNFTASNGSASIALSWTAVGGTTTSYTLSRSTSANGTYTTIASPSSSATSYTDTSLTTPGTYYYRLVANNPSGSSATPAQASAVFDNTAPVITGAGGAIQTVSATGATTISPTVSEPDSSVTYQWTNQTPGVGTVTFASPTSASTSMTANTVGTYTVRLTATNQVGLSSYIDYYLQWNPSAPTVTIGSPSQSLVTPGASVTYLVTFSHHRVWKFVRRNAEQ
ncbi:hypothetical protein EBZ80_16705 [bacterium]|nr:hypothetical protein [bacterium]